MTMTMISGRCMYDATGTYACQNIAANNKNAPYHKPTILERFEKTKKCNPGQQGLKLPYEGRTNCKDACSYYASQNSCPMMTGIATNRTGPCRCPLAQAGQSAANRQPQPQPQSQSQVNFDELERNYIKTTLDLEQTKVYMGSALKRDNYALQDKYEKDKNKIIDQLKVIENKYTELGEKDRLAEVKKKARTELKLFRERHSEMASRRMQEERAREQARRR
jgi:hypothetical protein